VLLLAAGIGEAQVDDLTSFSLIIFMTSAAVIAILESPQVAVVDW